ncbi:MAG: hypothetical protein BGO76_03985 [Caedibacter sp. 38-128]|nr:hypothetical protein [Holosporales bacterium]OJX08015.1 MAG: hypothetical protein BGO76_03985 [Caedibacter sp. 38-128]
MMQKPLLYSLLLHLFLVILFIFGLPNWRKNNTDLFLPIPIDVVEIGAKTQAPKPTLQPKKEETKKEEPKKEIPKKEAPKPQPKPEDKSTPEPEKPKPEPKAEPIAPAPKAKPKPPTPPKKAPEKKAPEKKKKVNAFDSVLKNLEEIEKTVPDAVKDAKSDDNAPDQQVGEIGDTLTISETDALKSFFNNCWLVPAGTKGAHEIAIIPIKVYLNRDGSVRDVKLLNAGNMNDPSYRVIAESALRSLKGPQCNPVPAKLLPPEKYEQWKDMTITFDPKNLM